MVVIHRLRIHQIGTKLAGELNHNLPILIHTRTHRLVLIRLNQKWCHQDQATLEVWTDTRQKRAIRRLVIRWQNTNATLVKLTPDIVGANHNRQPIRLEVDDIVVPARSQITHCVTGNTRVQHNVVFEAVLGNRNVAAAKASTLTNWTRTSTVRNRITREEHRCSLCNLHDFSPIRYARLTSRSVNRLIIVPIASNVPET